MKRKAHEVVNGGLVQAYVYLAVLFLFISTTLGGFIISLKFLFPDFLTTEPIFTFGRLRFLHANGMVFAWLTSAFFGITYYLVPKLTGRRVASESLGWAGFGLWCAVLIATTYALLSGWVQGLEYGELPPLVDGLVVLALMPPLVNTILTIVRRGDQRLYVSLWYMTAAYAWLALNYVVGNIVPVYYAPGVAGATVSGLYIHNLVGLWVTPMGTALVYYLLPALLQKPIFSHRISLIGFWTLAFFYPLNGVHHFLFSPIPRWTQVLVVPFSVMLLVVVFSVVYNFFVTMQGEWGALRTNLSLRFLATGLVFYILVAAQGAFQALLSVQPIVHFTDWVIGHAHLALFGVFSFWCYAFVYYAWPSLTGRTISALVGEMHYWLSTVGLLLYVVSLSVAGVIQGYLGKVGVPFVEVLRASTPYWGARSVAGALIICGIVTLMYGLLAGRAEAVPTRAGRAA